MSTVTTKIREQLNQATEQAQRSFHRLVLLVGPSGAGKTGLLRQLAESRGCAYLNVNLQLSQRMLELLRNRRPRQVDQRYPERDSMYFLPDQVADYDRRRLNVAGVEQLRLFVSDEKSASQWVRQQVYRQPMTFQELQPLYMKEAGRAWDKHEEPIELVSILNENFVQDPDDRWRTPDPGKEADLEQLRHRHLMKEFE
jgi:hypothetical protein